MEALVSGQTEKMIDISFADSEIERLAGLLNQYNDMQRMIAAAAVRDEEHLKDAVANISHDLRTPLTVMLGHLQLIDRSGLTEEQTRRIDIVIGKAQHMKALVETFYEYSLINTSEYEMKEEKINISNLLIDLISDNAPALEAKGLEVNVDVPEHSVYLMADRNAISRIVQNLLTNAIRYSAGAVGIALSEDGEEVDLAISNPVADPEQIDADRLFERFYTGDTSRRSGGTGLGLAVVKELVQKSGGKVSADCRDGELVIILRFTKISA
jgi:signal transduction histidine kinase